MEKLTGTPHKEHNFRDTTKIISSQLSLAIMHGEEDSNLESVHRAILAAADFQENLYNMTPIGNVADRANFGLLAVIFATHAGMSVQVARIATKYLQETDPTLYPDYSNIAFEKLQESLAGFI